MKIGIMQQNYVVGDFRGNAEKILDAYRRLCSEGAELVVGSELSIFGYPPKDLLEFGEKVDEQLEVFDKLRREIGNIGLVVGLAEKNPLDGKPLFNSGVFVRNGNVLGRRIKELLPTYDVFDERRNFEPGPHSPCVIPYNGKQIGILVCEDAWGGTENPLGNKLYAADPVADIYSVKKLDLLVIVNASPYYWGKGGVRFGLISNIAKLIRRPVIYVNQVGGNDELVFDGRSFAVGADGQCIAAAGAFVEKELIIDTASAKGAEYVHDEDNVGELYRALVLGTRDYLLKTGHRKVVIGESGGIDSALTSCIAVDAVGAENVTGIGMPSEFSSEGSVRDARALCDNLEIKFHVIPIGGLYSAFGETVRDVIGWKAPEDFGNDVTEENVQARLRGAILMAYSNRNGALVLSTGNKSELAVGYCTLYGDMVGGLAVISDVPKTLVYRLARYLNARRGEIIPRQIINKAPSAELRPGQKDQDSLPPYPILDEILRLHVEEELDSKSITERGFEPRTVEWVLSKIAGNEYKRRQATVGLKVTGRAFGSGRRIPIAMKLRT